MPVYFPLQILRGIPCIVSSILYCLHGLLLLIPNPKDWNQSNPIKLGNVPLTTVRRSLPEKLLNSTLNLRLPIMGI